MTLSNIIGIAICQLINPALTTEASRVPDMILYIAIISTPVCISALAIASKPPTPPSPSGETEKFPLCEGLLSLLKNLDFLCIFISFAIFVGFFNAFTSLIEQIMAPYGWSDSQAGIAGATLTVVGLLSAILFSFFLDKSQRYLQSIRTIVPVVSLSFLSFIFVIHFNSSFAVVAVMCGVLGASAFSLLPLALELAVECTHPVSPQLSTGILWISGQLFGAIFLVTMNALRYPSNEGDPKGNYLRALIFQGTLSMAAVPLSWVIGRFGQRVNRRLVIDKTNA
ncbi:Major facilitator superfamily domain-containing protein 7-a [Neolecta irregularis DAH-3]|uniref:Major facilitator superfamily domain-containing protein 7-a n=1 Tax=Neolecta irregularis (strain DAH-3) TaxID=1198029 RepID=A0A1U7LUJ6_NEOID|nr:Major facilitator superfamily domain-containing protein 7-a [Neolecta irregularis DAH-3]|eukprot:OLL26253.1 Major facilitator superfamily domain-containing protein 7-a [Neolecta irregularis DAH-3]